MWIEFTTHKLVCEIGLLAIAPWQEPIVLLIVIDFTHVSKVDFRAQVKHTYSVFKHRFFWGQATPSHRKLLTVFLTFGIVLNLARLSKYEALVRQMQVCSCED